MANNTLIIVGADKGGVGKTTVSRTLLDYLAACEVPARAFDTEFPRGTLKRFHSNETEIVDITLVPDQMKILDSIRSTNKSTIVDVRAGLLSPTLQFFQNIGFLDALKRSEVKLILFHVLGPSISSLREIEEISAFVPDAEYFMVKNFINEAAFFNWDANLYASYFSRASPAAEIKIPKLNEMAYEQVESAAMSFASFIANKGLGQNSDFSFVLRGYVRHWLANVWAEYDRVGLNTMLRASQQNEPVQNVGLFSELAGRHFPAAEPAPQ